MSHKPHHTSSAQPSSGGGTGISSGPVSTISSGTLSFQGGGVQNNFWDNIFAEDEDDNENDNNDHDFSWRDCIIFLIDCQDPMFQENENGEIPFHNAVRCVIATITDKIISSANDVLGVCFYGTDKKKNLNDFENIYVFFDLDSPDAQKILDLEALIEGEFDLGHTTNDFPFGDALWTCSTMFSNCPIKQGHKRIFLFTNEDNPNSANNNLRDQSFQRAKDLAELGIDIELFSMNKANERFDFTRFYQNIIHIPEDEDTGNYNFDAAEKFEELKSRVRRKEFKKRNSGKIPFYIGDNVAISVKVFTLVSEVKKGNYVWLDSKNNQAVKLTSSYVCLDTGSLLMGSQISQAYVYGGEQVVFNKDEINSIKSMDNAGMRLMGFKPRDSLKFHHNVAHSNFIYPDEESIKGSTTLFAALYERMLASDKIAIVRLTARANTPPRFCALIAQREVLDQDGSQLIPCGLHLISLPFADDLRGLKLSAPPTVEKEQIAKAKKLVKTLRIKFDSRNFENPALQKHYADLQAVALERDVSEDYTDYVKPDTDGMMRFKDVVEDFKKSVYPEGYDYIDKTPQKSASKRKREALADIDWVSICESGAVAKLTNDQLKDFIKCQGLKTPSKSKKENLVQVVKDHVESGKLKTELLPQAPLDDEEGGEKEEEDGRAKKKARVSSPKREEEDEDEEMEHETKYVTGKGKNDKNDKFVKPADKKKPDNNNNNNNNKKKKVDSDDEEETNNNNKGKKSNDSKAKAKDSHHNTTKQSQQSSQSSTSVASFTNDDDDDFEDSKYNKSQQSKSQSVSQSQQSSASQSFDKHHNKNYNSTSSGSLSFNNSKHKQSQSVSQQDENEDEESQRPAKQQKKAIANDDSGGESDESEGSTISSKYMKQKASQSFQRSQSSDGSLDDDMSNKPKCQYWDKCYRANPDHLKQFRHPPQTKGSFSQ